MKFLLMIFSFILVYANNVLNISYFPLDNKIDILFSLDAPFKGKIVYLSKNNYKITNITLDRIEQKKFNKLNIIISPLDNNSVNLKLVYNKELTIKPSITAKGYGLRIRVLGLKISNPNANLSSNLDINSMPQTESFNFTNYIIVISILIFLILVLLYLKQKALKKLPKSLQNDNYKLLYQKMIDPKNRIVMIELFNNRYLLLLGDKNNILLDKFSTQNELREISNQDEFDKLLEEKLNSDSLFLKNASKLKEENEL